MGKLSIVGVLLAVSLLSDSAFAACIMTPIPYISGQVQTGQLWTERNKGCRIPFATLGPTDSHAIAERPKHGKVGIDKFGHVIYVPNRDYVGKDVFVYVHRGRDGRNNQPSTLITRLEVTISP